MILEYPRIELQARKHDVFSKRRAILPRPEWRGLSRIVITGNLVHHVAEKLGISRLNAAQHDSNIQKKLQARGVGDLLKIAILSEMFPDEMGQHSDQLGRPRQRG